LGIGDSDWQILSERKDTYLLIEALKYLTVFKAQVLVGSPIEAAMDASCNVRSDLLRWSKLT
jgi:hypothetical protein